MGDCSNIEADEDETNGSFLLDHKLDLKKVNGRNDLGENEDEGQRRPPYKKDAGCRSLDDPTVWRWFVVAGMFVCSFFYGLERTLALYYVELMDYFETSSSVMSLIGSVYYVFFGLSGVVILPLSDKYGPRLIIMLGGVFLFVGLLSSAFAPNVYICIGTFGFFVGCGCSMTYLSASTVIMFYFEKKRALAQAIGMCGLAAGMIVLPICVQYLNNAYSWRGGLIIAAAMSLNVCVSGALVRPIKTTKGMSRDLTPENPRPQTRSIRHSLKKLLHSRPFILLCVQSIFVQASLAIITMHMKATAIEKTGVSDEFGSYLVSFYGAALFLGLLSAGVATQMIKIERIILLQIYYFCCACGISLIPAAKSFPAIVCFICIFAYFTAANGVILPVVLFTLVGDDTIRFAWAIRYVFSGIGGLAGPAIAGVLYDYTKDYYNSMYLGGSGLFLSIILMIEPCVTITRTKKRLELGETQKL